MYKNVASKLIIFCWDVTTGLPKTGDSANLTAYRSLDFGTVTVLADTSATEMDSTNAKGYYLFDLAQGETNGDINLYTCKSSTTGIACVGVPAVVHTIPATGILAPTTAGRTLDVSATGEAGIDWANVGSPTTTLALSGTTVGTVTTYTGNTPQTGDAYAQTNSGTFGLAAIKGYVDDIGVAGAGLTALGDARIANLDAAVTTRMATYTQPTGFLAATFPTTVASTTNITGGTITTATNLTNAPTAGDFTAAMKTSLNSATPVASLASLDSTVLQSGTAQGGASGTITLASGASATDSLYKGLVVKVYGGTGAGQSRVITAYNGTTKVATVDWNWTTTPDNTSTYAVLGLPAPKLDSSQQVVSASVQGNVTGSVASVTGNVGGNVTGTVGSVVGAVGSVTGNVGGSVASVATGGITAASLAADAITAVKIATDAGTEIAAAVWDLATTGHTTSGTFGASMNAAGSAGDPWSTSLPGAYGSGTAGHILGTSLPDVSAGSAGGLFRAGSNAATSVTTALTANVIGNVTGNLSGSVGSVSGAVGSVTGAVGSVTGNVGGNVTGSVGSISGITFPTNFAALGITAAGKVSEVVLTGTTTTLTNLPAITTDWVTSAGVSAAAVTKIQAGLSTYAGGDTSGTTTLLTRVTGTVALGSDLATVAGYVDTEVAAIKAKTDNLPASPAAVGSAMTLATGSIVAATFGANAINAAVLDPDVTTELQAGLATASALSTVAGYVDTEVAAIKAKTDNLPASPAAVGSAMTLANGAVTEASIAQPSEAAGRPTGILAKIQRLFE
jgi:hypothetical protein